MKKREVLKLFAEQGHCNKLPCSECPYYEDSCPKHHKELTMRLAKIGAMAILRQNRKKREFDPNKVLTCLTADKAKVGTKGYFADSLQMIEALYDSKTDIWELAEVRDYKWSSRFVTKMNNSYSLFYPIEE